MGERTPKVVTCNQVLKKNKCRDVRCCESCHVAGKLEHPVINGTCFEVCHTVALALWTGRVVWKSR